VITSLIFVFSFTAGTTHPYRYDVTDDVHFIKICLFITF